MAKFTDIPFVKKLIGFFKQGTSPEGMAISTTVGVLLGIFPVFGVTTWAATIIGVRFKLNVPLILALLYIVMPVQLALIIPFLRLGEWLYQVPPMPLSLEEIQTAFETGFFSAIKQLWEANLCAAGGWLAVAMPTGLTMYFLLVLVFRRFLRKQKAVLVESPVND